MMTRMKIRCHQGVAPACACFILSLVCGALSLAANEAVKADVEVTVVATREAASTLETAGSDAAVSAEAMAFNGATSLGEALRHEPGVSVPFDFAGQNGFVPYLGGGDQSINIRGMEGNRVAIQVDGIRQPEDFVGQAFLDAGGPGRIYFDPAVLSQVEIFKSAASDLYGSDALGGVVNAVSEDATTLLGEGLKGQFLENRLTLASVDQSFNNRLAAAAGDGRLAASVVYSYRNAGERDNNGQVAPNPQDTESHALVTKAHYKAEHLELTATLDTFQSDTFTDARAAEGSFFNGAILNRKVTQDDDRERLRLSLEGSYAPADGWAAADVMRAHVFFQEATASTFNVQKATVRFGPRASERDRRNIIDYQTDIAGLELIADKLLLGGHTTHEIRYGLEFSRSDVTSAFMRRDVSPDGTFTLDDRIGMAPSEVLRVGLFIRDTITLDLQERWVVTPGLRYDLYEVEPRNTPAFLNRTVPPGGGEAVEAVPYDNEAVAPSLSLLYRFEPEMNIYFSYARGIRNPSAEELNGVFTHGTDFIVVPNPDLEEERSDSFEVGLQGQRKGHRFSVAGFMNVFDGFIENAVLVIDNPEPELDVLSTVNRGEVEIKGLEVSWDWQGQEASVWNGGEAGLALSLADGEQTDIGQPLNAIDPLKLVGYLGWRSPDRAWHFRITGTYLDGKDPRDINQTTGAGFLAGTEAAFLLDLSVAYAFSERWSLRAGIINLTDEAYTLWSTARRGEGHGAAAGDGLNTQPGTEAFLSVTARF